MQHMELVLNGSVPLVLGGNVFGWTADRESSFAVLEAYTAHGGAHIDTADSYSQWAPGNAGGESETILGAWLAGVDRTPVALATKVGQSKRRPGLAEDNIRAALADSLERLGRSSGFRGCARTG
jgi:aryl-alcohol dehydrogenase-like predicted oxidoreductase